MNKSDARLRRVLFTEDDDDHAMLINGALCSVPGVGVEVVRARDGEEAIEYLRAGVDRGDRVPDLLLLDLKLPRMTGIEVLEWVRSQAGLEPLPVVVLTTSAAPRDRERTHALGANAYVVKPLDFLRLEAAARAIVTFWCGFHMLCEAGDAALGSGLDGAGSHV